MVFANDPSKDRCKAIIGNLHRLGTDRSWDARACGAVRSSAQRWRLLRADLRKPWTGVKNAVITNYDGRMFPKVRRGCGGRTVRDRTVAYQERCRAEPFT